MVLTEIFEIWIGVWFLDSGFDRRFSDLDRGWNALMVVRIVVCGTINIDLRLVKFPGYFLDSGYHYLNLSR